MYKYFNIENMTSYQVIKQKVDHKNNILKKYFNDKNVIYTKEILEHDGYDKYGPESNLWTLYIIIRNDNDYILYRYYYEDWHKNKEYLNFDINNDSLYNFESSNTLNKIENYDFYRLYKYKDEINNDEVEKLLDNMNEKIC